MASKLATLGHKCSVFRDWNFAQIKQSARWVKYIGLEGHKGMLKLYVANIVMNLWECDLLQQ